MAEVRTANQNALPSAGLIEKMEVYHPVSPDPSDVIPRTDLAGLKVYLRRLAAGDHVEVELWRGRSAAGKPVFSRSLTGFRGQELEERAIFVRLPLTVEPGWHTVRVVVNQGGAVDYRFITY
jgi:hypothetical protein